MPHDHANCCRRVAARAGDAAKPGRASARHRRLIRARRREPVFSPSGYRTRIFSPLGENGAGGADCESEDLAAVARSAASTATRSVPALERGRGALVPRTFFSSSLSGQQTTAKLFLPVCSAKPFVSANGHRHKLPAPTVPNLLHLRASAPTSITPARTAITPAWTRITPARTPGGGTSNA
jgi:hypothetical protein